MNYKKVKSVFLAGLILWSLTYVSCKDDNEHPSPVQTKLNLNIAYQVDGEALEFDLVNYLNEAGNQYSVTRLQYYISDVVFIKDDLTEVSRKTVQYIDARDATKNVMQFTDIPKGNYTGLRFLIGLNPEKNVADGLPATQDNVNMIWPAMMGGGYHFIKLEGHFMNKGNPSGYAVHLGTDTALVTVEVDDNFVVGDVTDLHLAMNINEWFTNPNVYDLADGNYTMGNIPAMTAIAANGKHVFSLIND